MPRPPSSTFASIALLLAALPARAAEPQPAVTGTAVSPAGHRAAAPDLAVGPRGEIALLWVDRSPQQAPPGGAVDRHVARTDVYVAISRDGGASFAAPAKANAASGAVWGQPVSRPRVAGTRDGAWHVAWAANDVHPGLGKAVLTTHYSRSGDGGRSFAPPRRLSTLTAQDMSGSLHGGFASAAAFGTLAVGADDTVHVLWIDTRHMTPTQGSAAIYAIASRDGGRSFGAERRLFDAGVCPCCQLTAVAADGADLLVGSREIAGDGTRPANVFRLAAGGGRSGGEAPPPRRVPLGDAPWKLDGCPLKPTVVASHGPKVFAAVHNGAEEVAGVVLAHSADGGRSFVAQGLVHAEASVSDAPTLALNATHALLAWHAKLDGPRRVFYRWYTLDGRPASSPRELAAEPGATAQAPVLATRTDGRFLLAWQQAERIYTAVLPATPGG